MENIDSSIFLKLGSSIMEEQDPEYTIDVFIEIAKNSHIKYEYDKEKKALICDRVLHTPLKYQFNYGFIPNTLSEDNDPIDVVVIMEDELIPGSYINCKLLGFLETKDDSGVDPKLIMCPSKKVDPTYLSYRNISDINYSIKDKIKYFFSHYKDLENKKVEIGRFLDKNKAVEVYEESVKRFNTINVLTLVKPVSHSSDDSLTYSLSQSLSQLSTNQLDTTQPVISSEPEHKNEVHNPLIKETKNKSCCESSCSRY